MSTTLFQSIRSSGCNALGALVMIFAMGAGPLLTGAHPCQNSADNSAAAHSQHHHGQSGSSAPESPVPAECSCIDAACNPPHAQLPVTPVVPMARVVAASVSHILASETPVYTAAAHPLPYANGPPASPSA